MLSKIILVLFKAIFQLFVGGFLVFFIPSVVEVILTEFGMNLNSAHTFSTALLYILVLALVLKMIMSAYKTVKEF